MKHAHALCWLMLLQLASPALRADNGCPDDHPWTGFVRNASFGFTFVLPPGVKGYWNGARCVPDPKEGCTCMGDHGRIVALGAKPVGVDRQMEMYADFAADVDEPTLPNLVLAARSAESEGESKRHLVMDVPWRLGLLPARRLVYRYVDAKTGVAMVKEQVIAVRDRHSSAAYRPYLLTPARYFATDEPRFLAMVRSFRLMKHWR